MEYAAIDVETANADVASICQVGIARFEDGVLVDEWKTFVDPEDFFDAMNIAIHGIDEQTVVGAPLLPNISDKIHSFLDGRVSVCHTPFDRVAVRRAFDRYDLPQPTCTWIDSACVARRTWDKFARRGYGLANVCEFLGYTFNHHDALEDAKAAAHILEAAMEKTGLDISAWLRRVQKPIDPSQLGAGKALRRDGNPEGPLHGEVLVFTGALEIPRREAANRAAEIGCQVEPAVTKRTTLLVVGDQDVRKLAGHEKSKKHRKAEILIAKGQTIRIVRETDFMQLGRLQ